MTGTGRPIRVLCVDDHRLMREGVARIVGVHADMEVVGGASNGEQAVAQFVEQRPDVTLMDLQLPVVNGIEAIRRIRQIDASARIVVLTMYEGDENIHRAFDAGAMGYVLKDAIPDDLIHVIREVHAGRQPRVLRYDVQELRSTDGLGSVVVAARAETFLPLVGHRVSRQRHDGDSTAALA